MPPNDSITSYRPHNSGHDYHDRGIYLITLVVREREKLLGRLNNDPYHPNVELSDIGEFIHVADNPRRAIIRTRWVCP